jgi:hypothetical protein
MWLGTPAGTTVPPRGVMYRQSGEEATKVEYQAAPGALVVEVFYHSKYIVDPAWKPPVDPPRVIAMRHRKHRWTCSWSDAAEIRLDQPVAAVRVVWTRDGTSHERILAPQPVRIRGGVELPFAEVVLGKLNCSGFTFSVSDLEAGVAIEMTAIRFDGSEVRVEGLPPILDLDELPDGREKTAAL